MWLESLRTILALAVIRNLGIIQFDIISAYLYGTLKKGIYMEQLEGYIAPGKKDWVCHLRKGPYRLVRAGGTWNEELNAHMRGVYGSSHISSNLRRNLLGEQHFAAAGFWVDYCVAKGSGKELANLSKSVDAKYGITGPGEVV